MKYVRRGAIFGSPTFCSFLSICILTFKTRLDTCCPFMHPAPSRPRHHHLPCIERSLLHHFPCMQDQAGVEIHGFSTPFSLVPPTSHARASRRWFHGVSTPFMPPLPPSHAISSWRWTFMCFHVIHISSISLACKGKPEVNVHGLSMLFPPSTPPLPARLSRI